MRRSLSSLFTVVPMVIMPVLIAVLFLSSVVGGVAMPSNPMQWIAVPVLAGFFVLSYRFARRLCFASTDGDRIFIWKIGGHDAVPLAEILSVHAVSLGKDPHIDVRFRSKRQFGDKVTIIPPLSFSKQEFWDVYELLSAPADKADHDAPESAAGKAGAKRTNILILGIWLLIVASVIALAMLAE